MRKISSVYSSLLVNSQAFEDGGLYILPTTHGFPLLEQNTNILSKYVFAIEMSIIWEAFVLFWTYKAIHYLSLSFECYTKLRSYSSYIKVKGAVSLVKRVSQKPITPKWLKYISLQNLSIFLDRLLTLKVIMNKTVELFLPSSKAAKSSMQW